MGVILHIPEVVEGEEVEVEVEVAIPILHIYQESRDLIHNRLWVEHLHNFHNHLSSQGRGELRPPVVR